MTTASPVTAPSSTTASLLHGSRAARIVNYIAGLKLPPCPTRLVGGVRLSPTDQRCKAALAVYGAIPGLDLVTLATITTAAKLTPKDARIAIKDLLACNVIEQQGHEVITYAVRGAK